mmetsp:Transcript_29274/g.54023  ORF Transcript_29274/g.54023 Transcript_29274/m.54023 type:complete len:845 (+) Transcript_29274:378-2912(+)|eukprot:CAMPEP_0201871354 /NCGR_PEP_ID=MMETSP0902-20130614/4288_1 /ASSEMBLY_ACC=CAM_ASM_000551 /TAXON_ID=420261 /ORGANISM="Thalassiosira antarctica, Strain CCMP982" /LENGTH=844 /DNA_ID=CAMNT_0048397315 /DNA_START=370 /DNA_END=2904 /DNA_ORIENTATION=+
MEIQERKSGKIYSLASTTAVPEWLSERSRRNLAKRDSQFRHRITLLQDLEMPAASTKVRQSPDGKFLIVGGTYSPRIRCYELAEMSMKFERYLDSEVVDIMILGEDYGKLAILGADRTVMFHAPYGNHEKIRLPTFGRAMAYEKTTCDLLVVSSGKRASNTSVGKQEATGQVYRYNLDEGRFSQPYSFTSANQQRRVDEDMINNARVLQLGGSCIATSPTHSLTGIGAEDGTVRFWDNRAPVSSSPSNVHLTPFLNLDVASATSGHGFFDENTNSGFPGEVTSICFDNSGIQMCAGTRGGNVALYDMRSSKPLFIKEHQYGLPIHTVQFHSGSGTVLSSDPKLVKIWNAKGSAASSSTQMRDDWNDDAAFGSSNDNEGLGGPIGTIVANVEGTADFSHFITSGDSTDPSGQNNGLLLCCGEQSKVQSFYCPVLGAAPQWCSFLDNITEELEEKDGMLDKSSAVGDSGVVQTETIYEDYKFLTRAEIDQLGIQNLVGTPLLRGYMHGFFIHVGLYNRIRAVAKPFEYNEYRTQKIKERMEEKRASRIAPKVNNAEKAKAKVNPDLAERLQAKAGTRTKTGKAAKALVEDDRFGGLFNNPDFEIDQEALDFKLRNPSGISAKKGGNNDRDMDSDSDQDEEDDEEIGGGAGGSGFSRVVNEEGDEGWGNGSDDDNDGGEENHDSDSDEDGFRGGKIRGEAYESPSKEKKKTKKDAKKSKKKKKSKNVMYEADDYIDSGANAVDIGLGDTSANTEANKRKKELSLSMEERLQLQSEQSSFVGETKRLKVTGQGAVKEVTFVPRSAKKKAAAEEKAKQEEAAAMKDDQMGRSRRGVKGLGFKTPFKNQQ